MAEQSDQRTGHAVKALNTKQLEVWLWLLVFLIIAGTVQLYTSYPYDADTAYHAAVGRLIGQYGILHSFPWTPFSWLADHYADKELLFHLLFVPLNGLDWTIASKIVGTLCGAAMLFVLYHVLRKECVALAGWWTLITLSSSGLFILRFAIVRPFVLSIALTIFFVWSASRNRLFSVFLISMIFPWTYVAFWQLPLMLLFITETARFASQSTVSWKPSAMVVLGITVGVLLHPNSSNLFDISWINMSEMLFKSTWGNRPNFEMGLELKRLSASQWLIWLPANVLMAIASLAIVWKKRRDDVTAIAFAFTTLGFAILTLTSGKFAEYFIPFSVASMALASLSLPIRRLPYGILLITVCYTFTSGARSDIISLSERQRDVSPNVAANLRQLVPSGAHIFTTDWDYTGTFMLDLPDRYFMVALDPTFFYIKNPRLYDLWYRLNTEAPPGSAALIRKEFKTRYVLGFFNPRYPLFYRLETEPGAQLLLFQDGVVLFDLGELSHTHQVVQTPQ